MIKLFDSLTQTAKPVNNKKPITIYLCGPTVYNYIHIGNARPIIVFDVLHRLLIECQYQVNFLHNITDIDDKIIQKAMNEAKTETAISTLYLTSYEQNLRDLNILPFTSMPKVSEHISQNIAFINTLLKNQTAYQTENGVYFDTKSVPSYGKLSNKSLELLQINPAINDTTIKQHSADFALWKNKTESQTWSSPFGTGRPGWHTECAAFINFYFNSKTITIHGGGVDLKFPHHENERAQYLAHNQCEIADIWMHIGHVNFENQKMSKSANNFLLVNDFLKVNDPFALRYLLLNHEHQQPLNLTNQLINESKIVINKYFNLIKSWMFYRFLDQGKTNFSEDYQTEVFQSIIELLKNNLDLTNTFTKISQIMKELNLAIKEKNFSETMQNLFQTFIKILNLLGFNFVIKPYTEEIKAKINAWKQNHLTKNYQQADLLRTELKKANILPD